MIFYIFSLTCNAMQGCGCNAWTNLKDKIGCNSGLRGGLLQAKQDECILHEVGWEEIIGNWFQCLRCCWELLLSTHGARIAALHRIKDDWEAAQLSGLRESVKPTFLGSEVCNELYYWATRSRKTCLSTNFKFSLGFKKVYPILS